MTGISAIEPVHSVEGERLADAVYRTLRAALHQGRIATGTRLIEQELAEALNVSRTPVREALRRLEADGILESIPHRGFVVVDILDDAQVVYAMRQRLEGLAAALAAHRITVPQLEALDEVQTRMEALLSSTDPESVRELARLNEIFHTAITEAAGSPRLYRLVGQLAPAYLSHQVVGLYSDEQRRQSFEGHRRILDALWKRDAELADRLVQEHLENGKRVVLAGLAEEPPTVA
jgi:DNA-binding GntR family transcriptional regulator